MPPRAREQLEMPRLIIRDFVPGDAADLHEILGDPETMKYCEPAYDFEKTRRFLASFCIARGGAMAAVHKQSAKAIGYMLFNETSPREYELGWFINRHFWRQGYAFEACQALIDYAFNVLGAQKVFAETVDPVGSIGLMHKLGMRPEELQHDPLNKTTRYIYALKNTEREVLI